MNEEKRFLDVHDVMEITGLSSSSSYIVIKQLNEELRKKGYCRASHSITEKMQFNLTCPGS